jgi:hypothetical protein
LAVRSTGLLTYTAGMTEHSHSKLWDTDATIRKGGSPRPSQPQLKATSMTRRFELIACFDIPTARRPPDTRSSAAPFTKQSTHPQNNHVDGCNPTAGSTGDPEWNMCPASSCSPITAERRARFHQPNPRSASVRRSTVPLTPNKPRSLFQASSGCRSQLTKTLRDYIDF